MTQEENHRAKGTTKKSGLFWMLVPVGLLVTSVSGWLVMVSIAVDDPGFAVEPDYYKKAANYDSVIEQRAENSRLSYAVELVSFVPKGEGSAQLVVSARGSDGAPLKEALVTADAFPVARSFDIQALTLRQGEAGVFQSNLERPRPGLWEVRVRVEVDGKVFTRTLRPELAPANAGARSGGEGTPPA